MLLFFKQQITQWQVLAADGVSKELRLIGRHDLVVSRQQEASQWLTLPIFFISRTRTVTTIALGQYFNDHSDTFRLLVEFARTDEFPAPGKYKAQLGPRHVREAALGAIVCFGIALLTTRRYG